MAEVLFYHMTESKLEDTLPKLVEKSLERGFRVIIETSTEACRDALDALLWTWREDSFLPHACDTSELAASQPVLLTTSTGNINNANIRFFVEGAEPLGIEAYQRVVLLFDGFDAAQVQTARSHWKRLKAEGHTLSYWQQNQDGRWEKNG